jgi:hypothetical protein
MSRAGGAELGGQAPLLVFCQGCRALHARRRGRRQPYNGLPGLQQLRFRLAHQGHNYLALASALTAKAAHNLGAVVVKWLRLGLQRRARGGALLSEGVNDLEGFFFAFYRVAASVPKRKCGGWCSG